jgi:hypothetical protein
LTGFRFLSFDDGDIDYDHRLLKVAREMRLASGAGVRASVAKLTQLLGEESVDDIGRLGGVTRSRTGQRSVSYTGALASGVTARSALEGEKDVGTFDESKVAESQSVGGMEGFRRESFVTGIENETGADGIERTETEGKEKDSRSAGGRKRLEAEAVSFAKPRAPRKEEATRSEPVPKRIEIGSEKEEQTTGEEEALEDRSGAQIGDVNRGRSVAERAVERHVAASERPSEKADGVAVSPDESDGTSSESSDHFLGLQELIFKHPLRARERAASAPAPKTQPEVAPVAQRRASLDPAKPPLPKAEQTMTELRSEAEPQESVFKANSDRSRTGEIEETGSLGQQAQRRQDPSKTVVKAAWSNGEPRLQTEPFRDNHQVPISAQARRQSKASEHKNGSRPSQETELESRIFKKAVDVQKPNSSRKMVDNPKKRQSRRETDGPNIRRTSLPLLSAQEWRDDRSGYVEEWHTSSQKA